MPVAGFFVCVDPCAIGAGADAPLPDPWRSVESLDSASSLCTVARMSSAVVSIRSLSTTLISAALLLACGGKGAGGPQSGAGGASASGAGGAPASGGDTFATQKTGPIAPNCASSFCAEVEAAVQLACRDDTNEVDFTMATRLAGKTDQVTCGGDQNASGGMDLRIGLSPMPGAPENNEVWFKLRNYTGPGTYPLVNLADEGDHMGLKLIGTTTGHSEGVRTVGTASCIPQACQAIVAEGSEPIPTDEMSTHEFRVRVEVRCPRGGAVGDMNCEQGSTRCTFAETPTLLADLACRQ